MSYIYFSESEEKTIPLRKSAEFFIFFNSGKLIPQGYLKEL
jgi:hypothetical protein